MDTDTKILIIDDNFEQRFIYKEILSRSGFVNLTFFNSATEAFNSPEIYQPYDLILMDIMMPEMDGIEACRKMKRMSEFADVPIIMITGLKDLKFMDFAFDAGAHDYITIPFSKTEILSRIKAALRLKFTIDDKKRALRERDLYVEELREALESVKTLKGLIPICSGCKNIRDDKGYWNQVEVYIQNHSHAAFTHGICPDCATKLYGSYGTYSAVVK